MTDRRYDILDRDDVLRVLFHPRPAMDGVPPHAGCDVPVSVAQDVTLGARLHVASADAPLIVFFHGNGEVAADYDGISSLYTGMGISLLVVDYRGYGTSEGRPTSSTMLSDGRSVVEQLPALLAEHALSPVRAFVMGRSLGSAAAIEAVCHAPGQIGGLILESAFADTFALVRRLGGPNFPNADEERDGFNNLGKVSRIALPTLIIHGEEDHIIPVSEGNALHDRCGSTREQLLMIPRAGHNDLLAVDPDAYFSAIREFVFV